MLYLLYYACKISQATAYMKFEEVMESFVLVVYASLAASRIFFATITSLSELYFRCRRFILLVQTNKVISVNYGSSLSSQKPWRLVRFDLILRMRNIYIKSNLNLLTKFSRSNRSTKFKDFFPWNISQIIQKTIPISMRNSHKLCDEIGCPVLSLLERKLREQHGQTFPIEGKPL